MKTARWWVLACAMAALAAGCGCGDDDDDAADQAIDDEADDDVDDDVDDDIDDDADDDADDDTWPPLPDDDADDDDTLPPLPDPTYGWIILDSDRAHVSDLLNKAADFGIDNVQLSHDLIMDIDEINESADKADYLRDVAQEAKGLGLTVWVWSHEFARESYFICFDPEDAVWERRAEAYREALTAVPEIDGVVLMFGSAEVEPWYAVCWCDWCRDLPPTGNIALDILHSRPAERLQQIFDTVGGVVMDEFGKELRVRTFMHQPLEIKWLRDALTGYENLDLSVMTKDVPQDWQPYYPDDPLIGDVGHRHQIIEMDLGNEYWGQSEILNGQVDYIARRWAYDEAHGALGAAARVERGGNHAFGNPNEINIYAYTRIVVDGADPDTVYREWNEDRYGLTPGSPESETLKAIFRASHDAMRKMYYTLGMWSMEKGSDVPSAARFPEQLIPRNTAFYDPDWWEVFASLIQPDEQTLADLWQESTEAVEIADDNLTRLESVETDLDPADYAELHDMLRFHADVTRVWRHVKDAMFRFMYRSAGHPEQLDVIEWDLERLLEMADAIESTWGAGASPGNPNRIRDFVADMRGSVPDQVDETPFTMTTLYDFEAEDLGGGQWDITWKSTAPATTFVEWTDKLPLYTHSPGETDALTVTHQSTILLDEPNAQYLVRVGGHDAGAALVRSGDWRINQD